MSVKTANMYGNIVVSDYAIAMLVGRTVSECYGVIELVSKKITDAIADLFNKNSYGKGVKITTLSNKIYVDIFVILKSGLNNDAVVQSIKDSVKYNVEQFTGMRVIDIKVNILGVRV